MTSITPGALKGGLATVARRPLAIKRMVKSPPDPRERQPELSLDFTRALLAALEKDPGARPTTATALARMLSRSRTSARG